MRQDGPTSKTRVGEIIAFVRFEDSLTFSCLLEFAEVSDRIQEVGMMPSLKALLVRISNYQTTR